MFDELIKETKRRRAFNVDNYVEFRTGLINRFFKGEGLDSAVVGVSGGVDSAVVIKLLQKASEISDSPIKKILGVIAPIYSKGITAQEEATIKAQQFCSKTGIPFVTVDLTDAYLSIINESVYIPNTWARGQMASVLRTPVFYYHAAILQTEELKSIVVGTTNRDEGSYTGFFGKASDAMVDLQPIADIHKSEVYQVAEKLGVPPEIINAQPKGDVYNGQIDEEMIGAPYWFLEMYLLMKEYHLLVPLNLTKLEQNLYVEYASNIEKLHLKNAHKYKVGLPSRFIDVMPRVIQGGWH